VFENSPPEGRHLELVNSDTIKLKLKTILKQRANCVQRCETIIIR